MAACLIAAAFSTMWVRAGWALTSTGMTCAGGHRLEALDADVAPAADDDRHGGRAWSQRRDGLTDSVKGGQAGIGAMVPGELGCTTGW